MRTELLTGSCHCGALRLELRWPADVKKIGARHCGCTFCRKHGAAWTSHPDAALTVRAERGCTPSRYRFGSGTADFLICPTCGVPTAVLSEIEGHVHAVVNVNALDDVGDYELADTRTDFDGEDTASRLRRRQQNWIAAVRLR